jgi:hypothetical protein
MIGSRAVGTRPPPELVAEPSRALVLWFARAALYLSVAASAGLRSGGDAAFVRLLANGNAILAGRGFPERFGVLSSALYAAVERFAGFGGIAAFGAFCAVGMLVLVEAQARARGASGVWALAAAAGAAVVSIGTPSGDGGSFAWLLAAAFAYTLSGTSRRRWPVAILLAWGWAASTWIAVAAPLLALAAALGRRGDRTLLWIAAGSALAILLTPAGLALPREAFAHLAIDGAGAPLVWQPNAVSSAAYRFGLIPIVIALLWFGLPRLADWPPVAVALTFVLAAGPAMPLAGIVILPCLVAACGDEPRREAAREQVLAWGSLGIALACAFVAPLSAGLQAKSGAASLPFALVERLGAERAGPTVVLCRPTDWCALVDALGRSDVRAFSSDRIGSLDERRGVDVTTVQRVRPGWRAAIARDGIDAILVANGETLATLLALQPDWRVDARDDRATLFVRSARVPR